jgi:hypothetical protein
MSVFDSPSFDPHELAATLRRIRVAVHGASAKPAAVIAERLAEQRFKGVNTVDTA